MLYSMSAIIIIAIISRIICGSLRCGSAGVQ